MLRSSIDDQRVFYCWLSVHKRSMRRWNYSRHRSWLTACVARSNSTSKRWEIIPTNKSYTAGCTQTLLYTKCGRSYSKESLISAYRSKRGWRPLKRGRPKGANRLSIRSFSIGNSEKNSKKRPRAVPNYQPSRLRRRITPFCLHSPAITP